MPVTPTGRISQPLERVRDVWANSATFQEWVGVPPNSPSSAKAFIKRIHLPQGSVTFPHVLVGWEDRTGFRRVTKGYDARAFAPTGVVVGTMEDLITNLQVDADEPLNDTITTFTNRMGAVIDEMIEAMSSFSGTPFMITELEAGRLRLSDHVEEITTGSYLQMDVLFRHQGDADFEAFIDE